MVLPTKRFCESLNLCFAKKVIDHSIFVRNRLMMLHPTRAVTLSREDFKADVKQIYNIYKIEIFRIEDLTWYDM